MIMNIPQLDFDQLQSMEYEWLLFDAIFASGYVGVRKLDHCFYEQALKGISLASSEAILTDDKKENVLAARKVSMAALLFEGTKADEVG
ncbi:hypothetical protein VN97_g6605 [Penicillium thymicola]|uniref:Uncharacterized protein n=1 Tax=Penicillium thymicola TaxID=293382 RepID=A0AAI9TH74_PENTH|nr:hypothetical protein VN97_g6605 [Penicillium thymicola]